MFAVAGYHAVICDAFIFSLEMYSWRHFRKVWVKGMASKWLENKNLNSTYLFDKGLGRKGRLCGGSGRG